MARASRVTGSPAHGRTWPGCHAHLTCTKSCGILHARRDQCEALCPSLAMGGSSDIRQVQQDVEVGITGCGPRPRCNISILAAHCRSVGAGKWGVPDPVIQCVDRWKSLAFLAYTSLATRAYNDAVGKMCNLGSLTIVDVRQMIPGLKRAQEREQLSYTEQTLSAQSPSYEGCSRVGFSECQRPKQH